MFQGNSLDSLFVLNQCKSKRVSSYDKTGGNHDWTDIKAGEIKTLANIEGCGIIRHIWFTCWVGNEDGEEEKAFLRKLVLRIYWDEEREPSVEVPLGDFFGIGFGIQKTYYSEAFAMNPENGKGLNCFFPMPFQKRAKLVIQNDCDQNANFYFYIDYEEYENLPEVEMGYFHACWNRESNTHGWAPVEPGLLEREKVNVLEEPKWFPKAWLTKNTTGDDNYIILDARGKGKFVGCNLNIDVFEPQANEWYGEGDDMFFIDGEIWPPSLHGTGTEDYFDTAYCPTKEYSSLWSGLTVYSGKEAGFKFGGKNSMYRLHIKDPIYFNKSLKFSIEHGHANKLSNDYSSTAYWYQTEPHKTFPPLPNAAERLPRRNPWESSDFHN